MAGTVAVLVTPWALPPGPRGPDGSRSPGLPAAASKERLRTQGHSGRNNRLERFRDASGGKCDYIRRENGIATHLWLHSEASTHARAPRRGVLALLAMADRLSTRWRQNRRAVRWWLPAPSVKRGWPAEPGTCIADCTSSAIWLFCSMPSGPTICSLMLAPTLARIRFWRRPRSASVPQHRAFTETFPHLLDNVRLDGVAERVTLHNCAAGTGRGP